MDKGNRVDLPCYFADVHSTADTFAANALAGKSVLVTGATGLLGRTVVELLACLPGCAPHALVRAERPTLPFVGACAVIGGGLAGLRACDVEFDHIVHCASPSDPASFARSPADVLRVNMDYAQGLLERLRHQGHGRLCLVSSGEVYGVTEARDAVFVEEAICFVDVVSARSCYPIGKIAAEALCVAYRAQHGVESVVARPCHLFGPNFKPADSHAVCAFLQKALARSPIQLNSSGRKARNYLYVVDAAAAIVHLLLYGKAVEAYNIASNDVVSIAALATLIGKMAGVAVRFPENIPNEVNGCQRNVLSNKKLLSIGWQQRFSLEQALGNTLASLRYFHPEVSRECC